MKEITKEEVCGESDKTSERFVGALAEAPGIVDGTCAERNKLQGKAVIRVIRRNSRGPSIEGTARPHQLSHD